MDTNKPKVVKWALILGIVIVLNLFINYSLSLVFNSPEYTDFCKQDMSPEKAVIDTADKCTAKGGQWNPNPAYTGKPTPAGYIEPRGYCDEYFTCNNQYQDANKAYEKKVFVSLVLIGVVIMIASVFVGGGEVLALSLSLGAVLDFVVASVRYWTLADDVLKVVILAIALIGLIWLAIKKFNTK